MTDDPMSALAQRLAGVWAHRGPVLQASAGAVGLYCGLETRTNPADYRWEGRKRSGSRRQPFMLFQYTLSGKGIYKDSAGPQSVTPGRGFVAIIPSDHVYYLPIGEVWSFFWVILHHPYVVQRIASAVGGAGRLLSASPASPVVRSVVEVFEGACRGGFDDRFDRELALFRLMLELERHFHERSVNASERETLLADVRRYVLERLDRRIDVAELAARSGMTRSHYSHHFKAVTARSPADYVAEVRLAEAARLLTSGTAPLKEVATTSGFADANHLCKVFRRRYHLTPGMYRRQGS